MTFSERISDFSAAEIIAATGCPRSTAYEWKDGRREPPAWQQPHWLAIIAGSTRKNKSLHGTPRKRSGEAEI